MLGQNLNVKPGIAQGAASGGWRDDEHERVIKPRFDAPRAPQGSLGQPQRLGDILNL
jgi:hypothetical protein